MAYRTLTNTIRDVIFTKPIVEETHITDEKTDSSREDVLAKLRNKRAQYQSKIIDNP